MIYTLLLARPSFFGYWRTQRAALAETPVFETIREAAEVNYGIAFGAAADPKNAQMPYDLALFALESNEYIPENTGKMNRWSYGGTFAGDVFTGEYNFDDYRQTVAYAESHGSRFRQHAVFYFANIPNWLDNTTTPPNRSGGPTGTGITAVQMASVMQNQLEAIRDNVPAKVTNLEIYNELGPYSTGWGIRESIWWRSPGFGYAADPDPLRWFVETYKLVASILPGFRLGLNDFENETAGVGKADGYFGLIADATNPARVGGPAPINWVGFQAHFHRNNGHLDPANTGTLAGMRVQLARTNDLPGDFEIHATEMDYRLSVPNTGGFDNFDGTAGDQALAGDAMHNYIGAALSYPKVSVMTCWGISDARSWLYNNFPGTGCGLPYGWDYRRKPMWWGMWNAYANQCDKLITESTKLATVVADRENASAGYCLDWATDTIGDELTFGVGIPEANTFSLRVGYYSTATGGTFQPAISTDDGLTWTDLGAPVSFAGSPGYTYVDLAGTFAVADIQAIRVRFTTTVVGDACFDYLRVQPTTFTAPPLIITETPQHFCLDAGATVQYNLVVSETTAEVTARFANPDAAAGCTVSITGPGTNTRVVTVTCGPGFPPALATIIFSAKHNGRKVHAATLVWLGALSTPHYVAQMTLNTAGFYRPAAGASNNASQWVVKGAGTRTPTYESGDTIQYVRSTGRGSAVDGLTVDSFYEFNRENFMRLKVQENHTYRFRALVRASANDNITVGVTTIMTDGGAAVDTVLTTTPVLANVWTEVAADWTPAPGSIPKGAAMRTYVRPFIAGPAGGVTLDVDRFRMSPANMNAQYP